MAGILAGALRAGREDCLVSGGVMAEAGLAGVASLAAGGLFPADNLVSAGGRVAATIFGFPTRLVFAFGLAGCFFLSIIISTAISGFSSAGGSGGSAPGFGSAFAEALSFGLSATFGGTGGGTPPNGMTFPAAFLTRTGSTSNSGEWGAAFAVADGFFVTTGWGFASRTGSATMAGFGLPFRSLAAGIFGSAAGFGLVGAAFTRTAGFSALAATLRGFFATVFFAFTAFVFEIFAPVLTRLRVFRREDGLAAAVLFGFFMTTILANGARLLWESTPGISVAQWLFGFEPKAARVIMRRRFRS